MIKHLQIIISGKVDNTGFRLFSFRGASVLKINGEVKQSKGKICIEAEGEESRLISFAEWCKKGTPESSIETFKIKEKEVIGYIGFNIL